MSAILTHDGRVVTINDEAITYGIRAAIEASGAPPPERTIHVDADERTVRVEAEERVVRA